MTPPPRTIFNARTLAAPFAAITMAALLFVYSRTSIRAAKLNAQAHRDADGGQISWRNESLRRHGVLEVPGAGGEGVVRELVRAGVGGAGEKGEKEKGGDVGVAKADGRSQEEETLRRAMGK